MLAAVVGVITVEAQSVGQFTAIGTMSRPRFLHTATLLPDGRVLIAGGASSEYGATVVEATAELFDPSTGTFVATGNMTAARWRHTATRLMDGRVLIVGGDVVDRVHTSAELYDPSTGTFTNAGTLTTARSGHQAVLLRDGRVLIVGGVSSFADVNLLASAELYDPYGGTFMRTGNMLEPFADTATALPNGTVLITHSIIGYNAFGELFVRHAEVYDPSTGTFSATGDMVNFHNFPTATLLRNGDVLIAGGDIGDGDGPTSSAELYHSDLGTFTATNGLTVPREGHTASLLSDGTVLIAGGHGGVQVVGGLDNLANAEMYDPVTAVFRATGSMTTGRELHQATALNSGAVLMTGGEEYYPAGAGSRPLTDGLLSSAELYSDRNLLQDGGFETDVPPTLGPAWVSDNPLRQVPAKSETYQPRAGRQNGACWTPEFLDCGLYQEKTASTTSSYTLRLFATADRTGALVGVNLNGQTIAFMEVDVRNFGDYRDYVLHFQAQAGDTIRVWAYSPPVPGYVVIDDVSLTVD